MVVVVVAMGDGLDEIFGESLEDMVERRERQDRWPNRTAGDFVLLPFEDVTVDLERRGYLVKGVLPREGLAVVWGPPKCR